MRAMPVNAMQNEDNFTPQSPVRRRQTIERCCIVLFLVGLGLLIYWLTVSALS